MPILYDIPELSLRSLPFLRDIHGRLSGCANFILHRRGLITEIFQPVNGARKPAKPRGFIRNGEALDRTRQETRYNENEDTS